MEWSSTLMASLKALLVLAGAVSIAVALRASVPSISDSLAPRLPPALDSLLSWFRLPYLFVVFNGIIITIAAISRCFHHAQPEAVAQEKVAVVEEMEVAEATPAAEAFNELKDVEEKRGVVVAGNGGGFCGGDGYNGDYEGERKAAFVRSESTPQRRTDPSETALVSPRLVRRRAFDGDHLQGGRASGKSVRRSNETMDNVCKEIEEEEAMPVSRHVEADDTDRQISVRRSNETMDNVCKEIEEEEAMPVTRHVEADDTDRQISVRRSNETMDNVCKEIEEEEAMPVTRHVEADDTDRQISVRRSNETMDNVCKEIEEEEAMPVTRHVEADDTGRAELHRQVEILIRRFNEQMKEQRQESMNRIQEMINRETENSPKEVE